MQWFITGLAGLAGLACYSALAIACSHRSGPTQTEARAVDDASFSSVVSKGWVDVAVAVGPKHDIAVNCDQELLSRIHTRVERETLVIESDSTNERFGIHDHPKCSVSVSLPKLVSLTSAGSGDLFVTGNADGLATVSSSGSGDLKVDSAHASKFELNTSGSGEVAIHTLEAEDVAANVRGSGRFKTAGKAKSLRLTVSGSGDVDARELRTEQSHVRSRGSADVRLFATQRADVESSGSGDVTVQGHPTEKAARTHGSGAVRWE